MEEDNILNAEKDFEIAALHNELERLTNELIKYKILLKEIDSDANPDIVSDEEAICVEQIRNLKNLSSDRELNTDEAKRLDLFHKNLKLARGEGTRLAPRNTAGKSTDDDLAAIIKS